MKPFKLRAPNRHEEFDHQCALFSWAEWNLKNYPELKWLNGSINGIPLHPYQAVKAKRSGLKRGVPDVHLPIRNGSYAGLWIEMKAPTGGRISPEQADWMAMLALQGHYVVVCRSWESARDELILYLTGRKG